MEGATIQVESGDPGYEDSLAGIGNPMRLVNPVNQIKWRSSSAPSVHVGASSGRVNVKAYTKKDGTHVRAHTRSKPKR